jgi:hypothetical protein
MKKRRGKKEKEILRSDESCVRVKRKKKNELAPKKRGHAQKKYGCFFVPCVFPFFSSASFCSHTVFFSLNHLGGNVHRKKK